MSAQLDKGVGFVSENEQQSLANPAQPQG